MNHTPNKNVNPNTLTINEDLNVNDDMCNICNSGGFLILCDRCPLAYCKNCVDIIQK